MEYQVGKYDAAGRYVSVVSGCGKNRGTMDSTHSRSAAYRHAKAMNEASRDGSTYRVLKQFGEY